MTLSTVFLFANMFVASAQENADELKKGMRVQVSGLKAKPELNGLNGRLMEYIGEKGRWFVQMERTFQNLEVKPVNLNATKEPDSIPQIQLRGGVSMPAFGLGTYRMDPYHETAPAVKWALDYGYRMIDTAKIYQNEIQIGQSIVQSGIPRDQIFIETKLWDDMHGYDNAIQDCKESIRKLGVTYLDLYVIHSPNAGQLVETWDALLEVQKQGLVKHLGVSNFNIQHLEALEKHGRPLPVINQVEMHPLILPERQKLVDWCKAKGIVIQAYGPLFSGQPEFLQDAALVSISSAKGKTPAQVLLRWGFQMGFQLIPKSTKKNRVEENMNIFDFELSSDEMKKISSMQGRLQAYWNPLEAPVHEGALHHWTKPAESMLSDSVLYNRVDYYFVGSCALAFFLLMLVGLKKAHRVWQPTQELQDPLMRA